MRDYQAHDDTPPGQWLELRPDALKWIAGKRDAWWYPADSHGNRRLNLMQVIADTGFDDNLVYRLAKAAECGRRVSLKTDTVAQLVRLGAAERGVKDETAFARIFRIRDPAEDRVLVGAAAA